MIPHIHTFATMSTKTPETPESSESPKEVHNEELFGEGDPDSNEQTLLKYLIEKGFVSSDCNREYIDVGEVPFIQSTAAEAAEAAETEKAAEIKKAFEAAKVAKAAKVAEAVKAIEAAEGYNPWGRRADPTTSEIDRSNEKLLKTLTNRGLCPPDTSTSEVRNVKFMSASKESWLTKK